MYVDFAHLPAHCGDVWFELSALGPGRQQPVARAVRLIRHAGQVRFPRWHHHLHLNLKVHQRQIFRPTFFALPGLGLILFRFFRNCALCSKSEVVWNRLSLRGIDF
jgi:hypothetical protein